jgi:Spy/CpxP family protein refolding chaperone
MKSLLTKFATTTALATGMALAQTPAAPAPHAPNAVHNRPQMRERMAQELNLTPAQREQAKAIFDRAKEQSRALRQQLKENREQLTAAVKSDNRSEIRSLSAKEGQLRGQMLAIHSEAFAKFYQNLTPDQRAKADQIHQHMRERS